SAGGGDAECSVAGKHLHRHYADCGFSVPPEGGGRTGDGFGSERSDVHWRETVRYAPGVYSSSIPGIWHCRAQPDLGTPGLAKALSGYSVTWSRARAVSRLPAQLAAT